MVVKEFEDEISSVKKFLDEGNTGAEADDALLLSADELPSNKRVVLQHLFEEVDELLREKRLQVITTIEWLENAEIAYEVTRLCFAV